jgi:hypothetical protein
MKNLLKLPFTLLVIKALAGNGCSSKTAEAKKEKEEDGFHLNISTKEGEEFNIDADGENGVKLNIDSEEGKLSLRADDLKKVITELENLNIGQELGELNINSEESVKLNPQILNSLFPENIGWFKRTEYSNQNAFGFLSSASAVYEKGDQNIQIAVLGGMMGQMGNSFENMPIDLDDPDVTRKEGNWNGINYQEFYNSSDKSNGMVMTLDNNIMVIVGAQNMSKFNFSWWWKRIDWKKLEG